MFSLPGSDAWSVRRVLGGHPEAFEPLVVRYQRKAHAVARAQGVPASSIDDVVQESFLRSFLHLPSLEAPGRFGAWFLQIVRNTSRRALRVTPPPLAGAAPARDPPARPAETIERAELSERLRKAVGELPEGIREAVYLYYYESASIGEVAKALSLSRAAARKRLQRGRDLLRGGLWRELRDTLQEMLPSAREWKRSGRGLALLVLGSIPFSLRARAAEGGTFLSPPPLGATGLSVAAKVIVILVAVIGAAGALGAWKAASGVRGREPDALGASRGRGAAEAAPDRTLASNIPPPPAGPPSPSATAPGPVLHLQVTGPEGEAVEDPRVMLFWSETGSEIPGSLADGPLAISPGGDYFARERRGDRVLITVAAPGFALRMEKREVPAEGIAEPVVIVLEKKEASWGRVVEGSDAGAPIAGAEIGLVAPGPRALGRLDSPHPWAMPPYDLDGGAPLDLLERAVSGEAGEFALAGLPGTIWASAEGYGPTVVQIGAATFGSDDPLAVPLVPPTTLRIVVCQEDGKPVEGFTYGLALGPEELRGPPFRKRVEGSSAVHMLYVLCWIQGDHAVPIEEVALGVQSGEAVVRRPVRLDLGGETRVEVVLPETRDAVGGTVVDPNGRPVPDAKVLLAGPDDRVLLGDASQTQGGSVTTTDATGSYRIPIAGKRPPCILVVDHPDHPVWLGEAFRPAPGRDTRQDVQLERGARLAIRMAEGADAAVDRTVGLETPSTSELWPSVDYRRRVRLDDSGRAEIDLLPSGAWVLTCLEARTGIVRRSCVSVAADRTAEVTLGRPQADGVGGVGVRGVLLAGGRPAAGMLVELFRRDALLDLSPTDAEGRFEFSPVAPGAYAVVLLPSPDAGLRAGVIPLEVREGMEPVVLDGTAATLSGRVVSAEGPLAGVEVLAYEAASLDADSPPRSPAAAATGPDGAFRLAGLYRSPHLLLFRKEGFIGRTVEWAPGNEEAEVLPEVVLEADAARGTVRFEVTALEGDAGSAAVDIEVYPLAGPARLLAAARARSVEGERLEIRGLPSGRYRAILSAGIGAPCANETLEIEHEAAADQTVSVRLRPGGAVSLELTAVDGSIPGSAEAEVLDSTGKPLVFPGNRTRIRFEGGVVLRGIPLGERKARVFVPGLDAFEVPLNVRPDRVARVAAVLPERSGDR